MMNKDKLIISTITMAICSVAVAYTAKNNNILVFLFAWIIGTAAVMLIHFISYKRAFSGLKIMCLSLPIALVAGGCVYSVMIFLG